MTSPIVVGIALRDDDSAPLALAHVLARLTGAPLALVTSYAYGAPPPCSLTQTRGVSRACPA